MCCCCVCSAGCFVVGLLNDENEKTRSPRGSASYATPLPRLLNNCSWDGSKPRLCQLQHIDLCVYVATQEHRAALCCVHVGKPGSLTRSGAEHESARAKMATFLDLTHLDYMCRLMLVPPRKSCTTPSPIHVHPTQLNSTATTHTTHQETHSTPKHIQPNTMASAAATASGDDLKVL